MLVKLTPGFNLTTFYDRAAFFPQGRVLSSFSLIAVFVCNCWHKEIGKISACKMLVELNRDEF